MYTGNTNKYTRVWFCWGTENMLTGDRVHIGNVAHDKIHEYLDKLNNFVPEKGCCMQYHFYFVLHSHPKKINDKMVLDQSLYIVASNTYYVRYLCGAQNAKGCMGNIKCGKCVDPFVRECIGKKFRSLEYINENNYSNEK